MSLGGPGATFWMVIAAFFGMSTTFVECSLAVNRQHLALILYTPEIREDLRDYCNAYQSGGMKTYAEEQVEVGT